MDPGHTWKWSLQKFPSVLLSARLWVCAAQIGITCSAYPNHCGWWCAPWLCSCQIPPQSILTSVADLVPAFVTLSRLFMGFCLSMADPNVSHPQSFPSLRDSVWIIRKHIFCSQFSSRTPVPKFHASPLQVSPICNRTWYLHVALLRCDITSHTDYVQLAAVSLHCRSHGVHAVCRFSPCLSRTMRMRAHMSQVAVQIWPHSPNLLDASCISLVSAVLRSFILLNCY